MRTLTIPGTGTQRCQVGESGRHSDVPKAEEGRDVICVFRAAHLELRHHLPGADRAGAGDPPT